MKITIYLSNLKKYAEGNENGQYLELPMPVEELTCMFNKIVGEGQEHIILDSDAPFNISEHENVFQLNENMASLNECGIDDAELTALFLAFPDREEIFTKITQGQFCIENVNAISRGWSTSLDKEEVYGMVLHETNHNNLFSQPIPKEMLDYINFSDIFLCLSINDGWTAVDVDSVTYLVRM